MRVYTTISGLFPASLLLFGMMGSRGCMDHVTEEWNLSGDSETIEENNFNSTSDTGSETTQDPLSPLDETDQVMGSETLGSETLDSETLDSETSTQTKTDTATLTDVSESVEAEDTHGNKEDPFAVDTGFDTDLSSWETDAYRDTITEDEDPLVDTGFDTSNSWETDAYRDTMTEDPLVDTGFDTSNFWETDAYRDTMTENEDPLVDTGFDTSNSWETDAYRDTMTEDEGPPFDTGFDTSISWETDAYRDTANDTNDPIAFPPADWETF